MKIEEEKEKKKENDFDFNICRQNYENNEKNDNIEIIFNNNNKETQYNLFRDSLLNLNDLPQKSRKNNY